MDPQTSQALPNESRPREEEQSGFERIALYVLGGIFALLPVLFIPSVVFPFQFTKTIFIVGAIILAFILFIIGRLKEGSLPIPLHPLVGVGLLVPVAYVMSAVLSPASPWVSFFGTRFETDTVLFVLFSALLLFLVPGLVRGRNSFLLIYAGFLVGFLVLIFFQGIRLFFGADVFSFGIFTTQVANLFGKWNDLGIFFGLTAILALITLEGLKTLHTVSKGVLYGVLTLSILFLFVVGYTPVWVMLGLFSLGFFLYGILKNRFALRSMNGGAQVPVARSRGTLGLSIASLVVLIVAVVAVIGGDRITTPINDKFGIQQIEARPSWQTTISIARAVYGENFLIGSGPNTFDTVWAEHKPQEVNTSLFWNIDFTHGIGSIPTSAITTGVLGLLTWLVFLGWFFWSGIRTLLLRPVGDSLSYYLSLSTWIAGLYLWVFSVIYVPNATLFVFAFFFTGLYLASLRFRDNMLNEKLFVFGENPRLGFITVLGLTVLLIIFAVGAYTVGTRYAGAVQFQRALVAAGSGDLDTSRRMVSQARDFVDTDVYARVAADLSLRELQNVLNDETVTVEERRAMFERVLTDAVSHAQRARDLRPSNYLNWFTLGRVYQNVVPLQIEGAYQNAKEAYESGLTYASHNPGLYLALAELEVLSGNNDGAREYITQALEEKSNYTSAVFLLAQIQVNENEIGEAVRSVEAATLLEPNNPVVFFQLGILKYNQQDYTGAAQAFERAIALNNLYANARYFLGLTYYQLDRIPDAILQFERVAETNVDNEEVQTILANLREGLSPFGEPPTIESPEERDRLPIEGE